MHIELDGLRRKHRVLVVDLPSIDTVIGLDFMSKHDVDLHPKQRMLSDPTASGRRYMRAYDKEADSLPSSNSSFIELCSMSAFAATVHTLSDKELSQAFVACLTPELL